MKKLLPFAFLFLADVPVNKLPSFGEMIIDSWDVPEYRKEIAKDFHAHGASFENIQLMIENKELFHMKVGFEKYNSPLRFKKEFSDEPWKYSIQLAESNPSFSLSRNNLVQKIDSMMVNMHRFRKDIHDEVDQPLSVKDIQSKHVLSLIDQYIQFFNNTPEDVDTLFKHGKRTYENGGMVMGSQKIEFVEIDTDYMWNFIGPTFESRRRGRNFPAPPFARYINRIGVFHTHPQYDKDNLYPSPSPTDVEGYLIFSENHPLQMDAVISLLPEKSYTVDLIFRDVTFDYHGKPHCIGNVIVYDIGTYKFEK